MSQASLSSTLRDRCYPVHLIADKLEPYLEVLINNFQPEKLILFGSYAYGQPTSDSDVDLLIVKSFQSSPLKEKLRIREAWRPVRASGDTLPFDLILETPQTHAERLQKSAGFYQEINVRGLRLV